MDKRSKNTLQLIEIQESVLPEDEWLIGISNMEYFNGVGYSMPITAQFDGNLLYHGEQLFGGRVSTDLIQSSNIDDPLKLLRNDFDEDDVLLPLEYRHDDEALQASGSTVEEGARIENGGQGFVYSTIKRDNEANNLYSFLPGIFYCSSQQTSVDAILIEVTQQQRFGMTLSSFRPEDVRALDLTYGMMLDEKGYGKSVQLTLDTLGSFHAQSFMKDTGIAPEDIEFSREIELASRLTQWLTLPILKHAYATSSFLQTRIMKLLDDIEFYGLLPRKRIYVRNEKHPYGTVVETKYHGLDNILNLGTDWGVACPDEIDLELELKLLTFSKALGIGTETDVEGAIMDMFQMIVEELNGQTSKDEVLEKFTTGHVS